MEKTILLGLFILKKKFFNIINHGTLHVTQKPAKCKVVQRKFNHPFLQYSISFWKLTSEENEKKTTTTTTRDEILREEREAGEMWVRNAERLSRAITYLFIKFSSIVDWSENNRTFMKHEAFPKLSIKMK